MSQTPKQNAKSAKRRRARRGARHGQQNKERCRLPDDLRPQQVRLDFPERKSKAAGVGDLAQVYDDGAFHHAEGAGEQPRPD